jgi:hypothetical protein
MAQDIQSALSEIGTFFSRLAQAPVPERKAQPAGRPPLGAGIEGAVPIQQHTPNAIIDQAAMLLAQTRLSPEIRQKTRELLQAILQNSSPPTGTAGQILLGAVGVGGLSIPSVGNRRLVYVHGICPHSQGFSDPWWAALEPYVGNTFGPGALGGNRLEVLWSDVVSGAKGILGAAGPVPNPEQARAAAEIREALFDRADRHVLEAGPKHEAGAAPLGLADGRGFMSIPGVDCVEDFTIYFLNEGIRQQILDRFIQVVQPLLEGRLDIDVVSHSWGTVVAFEALRQMADGGATQPLVRNFFTVGAALSIVPVKMRLRLANQDGRRPAMVRRWINLNARGDVVGGPLKNRPFQVDDDFPNLDPYGCPSFLGIVNPSCAHGSYFQSRNEPVNRDIFVAFMDAG